MGVPGFDSRACSMENTISSREVESAIDCAFAENDTDGVVYAYAKGGSSPAEVPWSAEVVAPGVHTNPSGEEWAVSVSTPNQSRGGLHEGAKDAMTADKESALEALARMVSEVEDE